MNPLVKVAFLAAALAAAALTAVPEAGAAGGAPLIRSADADFDAMTISVRGRDFGTRTGTVVLGHHAPLTVLGWTEREIVAALPAGIEPGSYLLVVRAGRHRPPASLAVTLGTEGPPGVPGPPGEPGRDADVTQFYTRAEVDALLQAIAPTLADGEACTSHRECVSGNCADGVCCDEPCAGACRSCALAGSVGTCAAVPDGQDPRRACQASMGGSPACAGACYGGQCAYPDVGTDCGLCSACDGTGRCTATPADDPDCGTVDCSGLDTFCRIYQDLTAGRCGGLGVCKGTNDPMTCDLWTDLTPCCGNGVCEPPTEDAASCPPDC